ncbi:sulfur carrier protein ThiS [Ottowia sp.]|uniref:sulfur carrier protein ThiS n=1 Tax=Ottowia sp. TaxID=1898956 RepID=UPI0026146051|nr:sulfur carrier protein ThiS [Ottowia sp.]
MISSSIQQAAVTAEQVTVQLDGQPRRLPAGTTLAQLVEQLGHAPQGVSTAVNGEFVARGQRAQRTLGEGDAVLLFQPIVGG